jgi:Zn-dependent M28 family amino/carboxypeptidase
MDLHTRPGNANDLAIANLFAGVVDAYDINLTPHIFQDGPTYSDHASFWEFGYSAIIGIEDDDDFSPYYHSTGDQLETLDLNYFTEFVKAAVGTFAHMGCLLDEDVR